MGKCSFFPCILISLVWTFFIYYMFRCFGLWTLTSNIHHLESSYNLLISLETRYSNLLEELKNSDFLAKFFFLVYLRYPLFGGLNTLHARDFYYCEYQIFTVGIRPIMTCWALGLYPGMLDCQRRNKQLSESSSESLISEERMEGDTRRNSSSDMMNAAQACILATKVTLQEV